MNRDRGFTLVELLVSLALASLVSAGVLMLVRGQLRAYDLNDAIVKAQQNGRAGLEFVETQMRRACGGIGGGQLGLDVPGVTPIVTTCVRLHDSATLSGGTFGTSGTTGADAIEIVYASGYAAGAPYATATIVGTEIGTTTPSVTVNDMSNFAVGDLVLISNFTSQLVMPQYANLYKLAKINGGTTPAGGTGPLTFGTLSANAVGYTPTVGDAVIKATSVAIYYVAGSGLTPGMLYLDPDGMAGADHTDAQPLIDGVSDFQVAVGIDWSVVAPANGTPNDGVITEHTGAGAAGDDEWIGNHSGETLPTSPWNPSPAAAPMLLQIRSTVLVRTTNTYAEPTNSVGPFEDGATITAADSAGRYPRYRALRSVVSPRAWNPGE